MRISPETLEVLTLVGIVVGAIQCFFGYRLFKLVLGLTGFIVGAVLVGTLSYEVSGGQQLLALIGGLVGGLVGAVLLVTLYFVGVFVIGAFLGAVLAGAVFGATGHEPVGVVLLLAAVACGVVALVFQKLMIILATAFGGSWNVVTGIAFFATRSFNPMDPETLLRAGGSVVNGVLLAWLVLGLAGLVVQYRTQPREEVRRHRRAVRRHAAA